MPGELTRRCWAKMGLVSTVRWSPMDGTGSSTRGIWVMLSACLRELPPPVPETPDTPLTPLCRKLLVPARPLWVLPLLTTASFGTAVPTLPSASGSRMLNCAIVLIFLLTHEARILPRCFSPKRERGKSPSATKATMSRTSWCSLRTVLTMTGTSEARKARVRTSAMSTSKEPAWKIAL